MTIQVRDVFSRNVVGLFGNFKSLIWTERYQKVGDFELITPLSKKVYDLFKLYRYVSIPTSKNMMVITTVEIGEDEIKISGKSLESVLNRRKIYEWRNVESKVAFNNIISQIFSKAFLNPDISERKVENMSLSFEGNLENPEILTSINRGDNVGDAIYSLCIEFGYGLRAEFDPYTKNINYIVYAGKNKNHISFSRNRSNFKRNTYIESIEDFNSSVMVAGSGEGVNRKIIIVSRVTKSTETTEEGTEETIANFYRGIERIEGFVDARDIQKTSGESESNYKLRLKNRGISDLEEHDKSFSIDGKIRETKNLKVGKDYNIGDTVTIVDLYFKSIVRIVEVIQSWSSSGYEIYPTFDIVDVLTNEISEEYNME